METDRFQEACAESAGGCGVLGPDGRWVGKLSRSLAAGIHLFRTSQASPVNFRGKVLSVKVAILHLGL